MKRRHLGLLAILAGLTPTMLGAAPDPGPAGSKTFQAWTATCNNLGACVVIGTAEADLFYVRIARDAGTTASPAIKVVLAVQEALKGPASPFTLTAVTKGKSMALDPIETRVASGETSVATASLAGDASLRVVAALRDADTLAYARGPASGTLDLKGLSAALRWMDARQGRAGTPTALVARGMTPIGQVPPPREAPVIVAAEAGSAKAVAKPVLSAAVLALATPACDAETVAAHEGAEGWRLGPDLVLVAVPCMTGAYNLTSALFLTDAQGGAPRPAALPRPGASGDEPAHLVVNAGFDPASLVLTEFAKGRGIGDCGSIRTWLWTGRAFAALDVSSLETCPGALPEDWPNVYTATRR